MTSKAKIPVPAVPAGRPAPLSRKGPGLASWHSEVTVNTSCYGLGVSQKFMGHGPDSVMRRCWEGGPCAWCLGRRGLKSRCGLISPLRQSLDELPSVTEQVRPPRPTPSTDIGYVLQFDGGRCPHRLTFGHLVPWWRCCTEEVDSLGPLGPP